MTDEEIKRLSDGLLLLSAALSVGGVVIALVAVILARIFS